MLEPVWLAAEAELWAAPEVDPVHIEAALDAVREVAAALRTMLEFWDALED